MWPPPQSGVLRGSSELDLSRRAERRAARAHELRDRGIQGAVPFYWLGRRMTEVIVEARGPGAVAAALEQGGVRFFGLYLEAADRAPGQTPQLGSELRRSIRTLGES